MSTESPSAVLLRRLAVNDERTFGSLCGAADDACVAIGDKTRALVRIAALIATGSAAASYQAAVGAAFSAGAVEGEVVDVLSSVAPIVGVARVTSAAPALAAALGYEVEFPPE